MPRLWNVAVTLLALVAGAVLFVRYGPYLPLLEPAQPYAHGHDDLVIRIDVSPGMGTAESFFSQPPDLVVTGDGTAYTPQSQGPRTGIVTPVVSHSLGEGRLQTLLKRAHHDGLLAEHPTYATPDQVYDGSTTDLTLVTGHGRWTHSAYALDSGGWGLTARDRLHDFVSHALSEGSGGPTTVVRPETLRVMALEAAPGGSFPVATWPPQATVLPAEIGDCLVVRDPAVVQTLTTRSEQYYRQGGTTYDVAAAVPLPGDWCRG